MSSVCLIRRRKNPALQEYLSRRFLNQKNRLRRAHNYRPLPADLVGGFLAGPAEGLTRAFFSTVAPASDPST